MHFSHLVFRNAARSPLRLLMTVLAVAIMVTAFIFPNALVEGQRRYREQAANDRVIILPKRGWSGELPLRYAEEVSGRAGVLHAAGVRWASLQLPGKEGVFFASNAVDPRPWLAMHPEIIAPAAQKQAFLDDEQGVLVSRDLARERGWRLGDRVVFKHAAWKTVCSRPSVWGGSRRCSRPSRSSVT